MQAAQSRFAVARYYFIRDTKGRVISKLYVLVRDHVFWFANIGTDRAHRRTGMAGSLIERALLDFGDHEIYLRAIPYADREKNAQQLTVFYGRYGFMATQIPNVLCRPADPITQRDTRYRDPPMFHIMQGP